MTHQWVPLHLRFRKWYTLNFIFISTCFIQKSRKMVPIWNNTILKGFYIIIMSKHYIFLKSKYVLLLKITFSLSAVGKTFNRQVFRIYSIYRKVIYLLFYLFEIFILVFLLLRRIIMGSTNPAKSSNIWIAILKEFEC